MSVLVAGKRVVLSFLRGNGYLYFYAVFIRRIHALEGYGHFQYLFVIRTLERKWWLLKPQWLWFGKSFNTTVCTVVGE